MSPSAFEDIQETDLPFIQEETREDPGIWVMPDANPDKFWEIFAFGLCQIPTFLPKIWRRPVSSPDKNLWLATTSSPEAPCYGRRFRPKRLLKAKIPVISSRQIGAGRDQALRGIFRGPDERRHFPLSECAIFAKRSAPGRHIFTPTYIISNTVRFLDHEWIDIASPALNHEHGGPNAISSRPGAAPSRADDRLTLPELQTAGLRFKMGAGPSDWEILKLRVLESQLPAVDCRLQGGVEFARQTNFNESSKSHSSEYHARESLDSQTETRRESGEQDSKQKTIRPKDHKRRPQ
ncbi:hypothetical protein B0H11DRAFT_1944927 [Mycena galericulata]|nr:hypothetical protein B0H11DRAFT_1944927 [Mycena galericulata]